MKNLIGCFLVFLLGVAATLGFLAWREKVRERGAQTPAAVDVEAALETRDELVARVLAERRKDGVAQIVLTEDELRALAISAMADDPRGEDLARVVRKVEVELEEDALEFGVSVDVNALERSGLVEGEDLQRVLDMLPVLRGREVYLGFRGVPGARDGRIALADDLEINLGILTLPVEALAEKLGFSTDALSSKLEFEVDGFAVDEVRAGPGTLTLEARAR